MGRMKMKKNKIDQKKTIEWTLKAEKSEYKLGDKVRVYGHFLGKEIESSDLTIHSLLKHTDVWDFPKAIIPISLKLEPHQEKELLIREFEVTNDYPPGKYNLKVGLEIKPKMMEFKELQFNIKGTLKTLDYKIIISRDRESKEKAKVFTFENKHVYFSLKSTLRNVVASGFCINPEGKKVDLEFDGLVARYRLSGAGVYKLEVNGYANGYKPLTKRVLFSVIEHPPRFNVPR